MVSGVKLLIGLESVDGIEFISIEFLFVVVFGHIFIEIYLLLFVVAKIILNLFLFTHSSKIVILLLNQPGRAIQI